MSAVITLPVGAELCHLPASFPLARGGVLEGAVLAFERQGPVRAPVVVVLGGISAGRHVSAHAAVPGPGWWQDFVGPG
ncbi:MAG TPA: homoserine O-acetyltransferase, partial [Planctomycetota bacterium]|nr:homoserine O-acetyltransferase [Planctomycetota bacterium]